MVPQWILDSHLLHPAMIIAASDILRPETRGDDILEDIFDFWNCSLCNDLQDHLAEVNLDIELGLRNVTVHSGSAEGDCQVCGSELVYH
jgi:hypothetical protein